MRKAHVSNIVAGLALLALVVFFGGCATGDDVAYEKADFDLEEAYALPEGHLMRTTENEFNIVLENAEEPEHDFYYVVWLKDGDALNATPWVPMASMSAGEGVWSASFSQEDIVGEDFTSLDQVLVSIEEDTDESGLPDLLDGNGAGTPTAIGPAQAMFFSEDFSEEGGIDTIVNEHVHFGDGINGIELDAHAFEHSMGHGNPGSRSEMHVDYIRHRASLHVKDTPHGPPGFHYALWGMSGDGSTTIELADVDLEEDVVVRNDHTIGSGEVSVSLASFDLFDGVMFQITLEADEGEHTKSPVIIHSGELQCVPGHCPGGGSEPEPIDGGGDGGGHVH